MISSSIYKKVHHQLANLRAETEITEDDLCYAKRGISTSPEDMPGYSPFSCDMFIPGDGDTYTVSDDIFEDLLTAHVSDAKTHICATYDPLADKKISSDDCEEFYQYIAGEAKKWSEKPSDVKNIKKSLKIVLELAKQTSQNDCKLGERLKREESIRIISRIVDFLDN